MTQKAQGSLAMNKNQLSMPREINWLFDHDSKSLWQLTKLNSPWLRSIESVKKQNMKKKMAFNMRLNKIGLIFRGAMNRGPNKITYRQCWRWGRVAPRHASLLHAQKRVIRTKPREYDSAWNSHEFVLLVRKVVLAQCQNPSLRTRKFTLICEHHC